MNNLLEDLKTLDINKSCKGIIYKAEVSLFQTKRGIGYTIRLNEAKKLSCPGCSICNFKRGYDSGLSEIDVDDWPIIGIENVKNGKYYTLETINQHRDYETGIIDDWDLALVEVNPT